MTNNKRHDSINYLLLLIAGLSCILFVFFYCWIGTLSPLPPNQPIPFHRQLLLLLQDVLAGAIGALISFVVVYMLFISKGLNVVQTNIIEVMDNIIETTKNPDFTNRVSELIQKILKVFEKEPLTQQVQSIMQPFLLKINQNNLENLEQEIDKIQGEIDKKMTNIIEGVRGISTEEKEIEQDLKYLLSTLDETKRIISETVIQIKQQSSPVAKGKIIQQLLKDIRSKGEDDLKLYTFAGLEDQPIQNNDFQNFALNPITGNVNAVYFLWADVSAGNEIKAKIEDEQGNKFLRVSFDNKSEGGSNIAIRPYAEKVHHKTAEMRYLTFDLRITEENKNILLGFRLVNGWLQHWHYSNSQNIYITLLLNERYDFKFDPQTKLSRWISFSLDIETPEKWHLFDKDGNHRYGPKKVDFSLISFVIFEFGKIYEGQLSYPQIHKNRPGKGKGEVEIRQIKLTSTQGDFLI